MQDGGVDPQLQISAQRISTLATDPASVLVGLGQSLDVLTHNSGGKRPPGWCVTHNTQASGICQHQSQQDWQCPPGNKSPGTSVCTTKLPL